MYLREQRLHITFPRLLHAKLGDLVISNLIWAGWRIKSFLEIGGEVTEVWKVQDARVFVFEIPGGSYMIVSMTLLFMRYKRLLTL